MSARGGKKRQRIVSKSTRAGLLFPVSRLHRYLKKGLPKWRVSAAAPVYQAAVLEYLTGLLHRFWRAPHILLRYVLCIAEQKRCLCRCRSREINHGCHKQDLFAERFAVVKTERKSSILANIFAIFQCFSFNIMVFSKSQLQFHVGHQQNRYTGITIVKFQS